MVGNNTSSHFSIMITLELHIWHPRCIHKNYHRAVVLEGVDATKEESGSHRANADRSATVGGATSAGGSATGLSAAATGGGGGSGGSVGAATALGFGFESVEGLVRSRVDSEDHSAFAVSGGLAVEPGRLGTVTGVGVVESGWCGGAFDRLAVL